MEPEDDSRRTDTAARPGSAGPDGVTDDSATGAGRGAADPLSRTGAPRRSASAPDDDSRDADAPSAAADDLAAADAPDRPDLGQDTDGAQPAADRKNPDDGKDAGAPADDGGRGDEAGAWEPAAPGADAHPPSTDDGPTTAVTADAAAATDPLSKDQAPAFSATTNPINAGSAAADPAPAGKATDLGPADASELGAAPAREAAHPDPADPAVANAAPAAEATDPAPADPAPVDTVAADPGPEGGANLARALVKVARTAPGAPQGGVVPKAAPIPGREAIHREPWSHDLYTLLRRIERVNQGRPRVGAAVRRRDDVVTLEQDPFMVFPASTINRSGDDKAGRVTLSVRFLGLLGPMGAMPLSLTEESYQWHLTGDDAFGRFLDIINHRFLETFYRAWADPRPVAQHDRRAEDRFLVYLGALIGMGSDSAMTGDSVPNIAKVAYSGLLSPRVKSASRLKAFLAGLFDVAIAIEEFIPMALTLEPDEQSRLGAANCGLGIDAMLGATVLTFEEKIRVRVTTSNLVEYQSFLPTGENAARLADAIRFYLGDELEYDVELSLPVAAAPAAKLGQAGQLGWTGWMNPQHPGQMRNVLNDARYRPDQRRI